MRQAAGGHGIQRAVCGAGSAGYAACIQLSVYAAWRHMGLGLAVPAAVAAGGTDQLL